MRYIFLLFLPLVSCTHDKQNLIKNEIKDDKGKVSNVYYTNSKSQKDSVEHIYSMGKNTRDIFWSNGSIDSILNYKRDGSVYSYEVVKDSISYVYDTNNQLIQKSFINKNGRYEGIMIKYKDSLINNLSTYDDGEIKGLVVHLNDKEYPVLIGKLINNSFPFGIEFYNSGKIKTLRINNKTDKFGIIYNYDENGNILNKVKLKNGKPLDSDSSDLQSERK